MYAINLNEDNRILRATFKQYAGEESILVGSLPEGDITDYKYIDGNYIYEPKPKPEDKPAEPTAVEDLEAIAVDHEYRLTLLELGV